MIKLSNAHIIIESDVISKLFNGEERVAWIYYPQRKSLMIAASADELFKSLHKTTVSVLKYRNSKGDRSLDILSVIIDHDIDNTNRELPYRTDKDMKVLTITLE